MSRTGLGFARITHRVRTDAAPMVSLTKARLTYLRDEPRPLAELEVSMWLEGSEEISVRAGLDRESLQRLAKLAQTILDEK